MENLIHDLELLLQDIQKIVKELRTARKEGNQDAVRILKAQLNSDLQVYLAARELQCDFNR